MKTQTDTCGTRIIRNVFVISRSSIRVAPIVFAAAAMLAQQSQPAGSLLDGLAPASSPAALATNPAPATPAEVKMNEGAPKLKWTMSVGDKNKKAVRHFHEEQGYLLMKSGQRLDGFITFRAESRAGGPWKISQVEFREAKEGSKRKLPPDDVEDFTFLFTMADYKGSSDPARNFTPGSLTLTDGTRLQGYVALAKIWSAGSIGGAGSRAVYFAPDESANIQEFKPARVQEMAQSRADGEFRWINYTGQLVPVLVQGKNLLLFRNPHPTTRATGFLAGLRGFGGSVASGMASEAAARGAARQEAERRVKSGQDIGSVAAGSAAAGQQAADATGDAFSEIDFRGFKTEYVIRNLRTGFEAVVTDQDVAERVGPLLDACPATAALDRNQRKEQLRFNNLEKLISQLDKCF